MINSAEEFLHLRSSEKQEDCNRAAHDEAPIEVWHDVINKYPDLCFWVAQNKTVPLEILEILSKIQDPKVRGMVARKRKLSKDIMLSLANDEDASVRNGVASNTKVSNEILKHLSNDPVKFVRENAAGKLKDTRNQ